ncbi:exopolysaccharide biosynthesis protein [Lysobacter humi (ex Lee et al. 2017)]
MRDRAEASREVGTRALLDRFADGDAAERLRLGDLFRGLGDRSFGMLLIAATAPAFIPIPGLAGALSGPLVMLVGVQLLLRLRQPWLPGFVARRGPNRGTMARLRDLLAPWLGRLEHVVRPRATVMLDHWLPDIVTGLLVLVLGLLLSLPIPFTNYILAALLLLFALALLERDGVLMGVAWLSGLAAVVVFGVLSGSLAGAAARFLDRLG